MLLPGMDGTGELFDEFLTHVSELDHLVIPFPQYGPQDYLSLRLHIEENLPDQDFILLAESFSGALAAQIALDGQSCLRGIIFVGSFLSAPNRLMLSLTRCFPIKAMFKLPFHALVLRRLMLGSEASQSLIDKFRSTVVSVPNSILKARISAVQKLVPPKGSSQIPAFYIFGDIDRLVGQSKLAEFKECFPLIKHYRLKGPHFLLQANPTDCATQLGKIISLIAESSHACSTSG